jgi:TonB family protein
MFTTLIESTPHKKPSGGAGLVSALFHSALIAGAIYATASGAASKVVATAGTQAQKVLWVKPSAQPQSAPAPKPKVKPRPVVAPTKVPTSAPRLDPNAQPTPEPDAGATNLAGGGTPGAFNSFEVDVEVVAVAGTIRPQYPEMLRSSGTEGQVIAQFVVNEKGRADSDTFRVLSSTHPQFTAAVNRALPYMRFKPATIRGKPVSQLVQQLFVFKLDR